MNSTERPLFIGLAVLIALLLIAAMISGHRAADAAPLTYVGSLELRSPVWASRDTLTAVPFDSAPSASEYSGLLTTRSFVPSIRFLDLAGSVRFTHPDTPLALWVSGEHSFSRGYFVHENKMRVGLDFPLPSRDLPLTLFSYWERRFDSDLDRVFVGARVGFQGTLR